MKMKNQKDELGILGESMAAEYLTNLGWRVVSKNFKNDLGEVDIIAWDNKTIVFIEVKTRSSDLYGSPLEAVGKHKQKQLVRVAQSFLKQNRIYDTDARFDVIGIICEDKLYPEIQHVKNAFEAY